MAITQKKLKDTLTRQLRLRKPRFVLESLPGGKLSGNVISDSFQGLDDVDRQKRIWDALEGALGRDCVRHVGTLLAYTDNEWDVDFEEVN